MTIENINVRFFATRFNDDEWPECFFEIVEVTESLFLELGGNISYDRSSVFQNGCRQICLTTDATIDE